MAYFSQVYFNTKGYKKSMKNFEQRLFIAVISLLCSFTYVDSTKAMTETGGEGKEAKGAASISASVKTTDGDSQPKTCDEIVGLHTLFTKLFSPRKPLPITSPRGFKRSATWPDFTGIPQLSTGASRRSSAPDTKSIVSLAPNTATEFVNMLRQDRTKLRNFVDGITLEILKALLSYYGSDLLYELIHDKMILSAIDSAISRNTFMQGSSESDTLENLTIAARAIIREHSFDEPVADVTVIMHLAQRGLKELIELALTKKYVTNINVMTEDNKTALDLAESAYDATQAMLQSHGASTLKVLLGQQSRRLSECIDFLKRNNALTGQQVLAREKIARDLVKQVIDDVIQGFGAMKIVS